MGSVSIISPQINFIDTVIVGYRQSNTKVYPPRQIPIRKLLYKCKLKIKLNGDDFLVKEPIIVKCILPNGNFHEELFNAECNILTSNEFYEFTSDIISQDRLNGWSTIELLRYNQNGYEEKFNAIIRYDKVTLFIN
jgi:hypothetical protein